ncbi:MAG: hypothetical protein EPO02_13825 [Nitrospirae bacterium]|nr:MAG: hypothetical protein EPO02_13825 [Nitrospirota bacterium]
MLDTTYSGLLASVADFLNRADLTATIPDLVVLAEAQMNRQFITNGPPREMMGRSDATINAEFMAVPSDFLATVAIYLTTTTGVSSLKFTTPEKIVELKVNYPSESGDPQRFTVLGTAFQFWPWTSGTYTGELTYYKTIPPLATNTTGNWLLSAYPDAYLYGTLLQSAPYLKDDARIQVWGTAFQQILSDICATGRIARDAPMLAIPRNPMIV